MGLGTCHTWLTANMQQGVETKVTKARNTSKIPPVATCSSALQKEKLLSEVIKVWSNLFCVILKRYIEKCVGWLCLRARIGGWMRKWMGDGRVLR